MLDTISTKQDDLKRHSQWALDFLQDYPAPALDMHPYRAKLAMMTGLVRASSKTAAGPAMRLTDAVWALHVRMRFPNVHAFQVVEENHFWHLQDAHRNTDKAKVYRVWEGIEEILALRNALIGPLPLLGTELPDLNVETPQRKHQRALFRLQKRLKSLPFDHTNSQTWLKTAIEKALQVPPSVQLLDALVLFSKLVWAAYPEREATALRKANGDFFSYVNGHTWLRKTEMAPLIDHLPCR